MDLQSLKSSAAAAVSFALLVLTPASAQQGYVFTKVIDGGAAWPTGGGSFNLGAATTTPSYDGKWIVFRDPGPQTDGGSHAAIWSYNVQDQSLRRLVDFNTVVPGGAATFSDLELGNTAPIVSNGTVIFVAHDGGGATNQGLYSVPAAGGAVTRIANYTTPDPSGGFFTVFGNTGSQIGGFSFDGSAVAFAASGGTLTSGSYSAAPLGAAPQIISDVFHVYPGPGTNVVFYTNPVVNGSSVVLAGSNQNQTYEGLYLGSVAGSGVLTELVNSNQNLPGNPNGAFHTRFDTPAIAFDGTAVVFRAHDSNAPGLGFFGLYYTDLTSHSINKIVDLNSALPGLGRLIYIANGGLAVQNGMVLFRATDINNNSAIYQWRAGTVTRIIGTGDSLSGAAVTAVGEPGTTAMSNGNFVVTAYTAGATMPSVYLATPALLQSVLAVTKTHSGSFTQGQTGGTYTITVTNQAPAPPTSGTIIVSDIVPTGMTLTSISGDGWACGGNQCSRRETLLAGASYPPITVTVSVAGNAPAQLTNQVTVIGGNSPGAVASDTTVITAGGCTTTFSPQAYADAAAQTIQAPVTSQPGCSWAASSNTPWVTITSTSPTMGSGTVSIAVTLNNTGAPRTGTVTIGGNTLTVVQRQTAAVFADVPASNDFFDAANLMYSRSITSGCSSQPVSFCPDLNITRFEMAVVMTRAVMGGDNFIYSATPYFNDVPAAHPYFKWIQKLRELGITTGCTANLYCPDSIVTRGQMAAFVIRARYGASNLYNYPTTPYFTDVPATDAFFAPIQKMKQVGITSGCAVSGYCPEALVTRGQAAVFIMRGGFNQLLPPGTPVITSINPASTAAGGLLTVTIHGQNTNFVGGVTQVSMGAGVTVGNVNVIDGSNLTAQVVVAFNAVLGPRTVVAITGAEEAVLPNGFRIQ